MDDDDYLYHVTYYANLGTIAARGLRPGAGGGIGGSAYDAHRRGAIFLTEADGVFFWATRAEEWTESRSDDIEGDGLAPVLLRVEASKVERFCEDDELGSRDARSDAYRCTTTISPDDLEVWAGVDDEGEWVDVDDYGEIPYDDAFETDSDGDLEWTYLKGGGGGSPLIPSL